METGSYCSLLAAGLKKSRRFVPSRTRAAIGFAPVAQAAGTPKPERPERREPCSNQPTNFDTRTATDRLTDAPRERSIQHPRRTAPAAARPGRTGGGSALVLSPSAPQAARAQAPPKLAPPVEKGRWIVPAEGAASEPIWGVKGGIVVGLWPTGGPRGLLRIYAPYLGHPAGRMINFIAVEPIVGGDDRGLSELERSTLDNAGGKAMWSTDDFEASPRPRPPWQPARGKIIGSGNSEALVFHVAVERFNNGAHPVIKVMLRQDRPHEVTLTTYAANGSASMRYCILSATMGNFARLRDLWLKGEIVRSTLVYKSASLDSGGVLPASAVGPGSDADGRRFGSGGGDVERARPRPHQCGGRRRTLALRGAAGDPGTGRRTRSRAATTSWYASTAGAPTGTTRPV